MRLLRNLPKTGILLIATLLPGFFSPALANGPVSLNGTESGKFISDLLPFVFPIAHDGITAEGNATGIGHYTMSGTFVANVLMGIAAGNFTMTADDGDELFLDVKGGVIPADHSQVLWNNTITGGTGEFAGATGSFTSQVQLEGVVGSKTPNPYVATLSGTLSTVPEGGPIPAGLVVLGLAVSSSFLQRRSARCNSAAPVQDF